MTLIAQRSPQTVNKQGRSPKRLSKWRASPDTTKQPLRRYHKIKIIPKPACATPF